MGTGKHERKISQFKAHDFQATRRFQMRLAATELGLGFVGRQMGNSRLPAASILSKTGSEIDRWDIGVFQHQLLTDL